LIRIAGRPVLRRTAGNIILASAALLIVAGLGRTTGSGPVAPVPPASQVRALISGEAGGYEQALRRLDLKIQSDAADAAARPGEWLFEEALARALLARARLSGNYEDYALAQAAVDRAFRAAPPGTGPHLTAAILAFSLHRLDESERMLDRIDGYAVPPAGGDLAEVLGMRGDIALYRGDGKAASRFYRRAEEAAPGSADFRMAIRLSHQGLPAPADAALARVAARMRTAPRRARAQIALQRGIVQLDNGRHAAALERFREADRLFPGYWLIEEHIAETLSLTGRDAEAEAILKDVTGRTGHPEYMDALANLARKRGDTAEASRWSALARQGWERRVQLFPEAAYGHGIDHCLAARDAACALRLAMLNHRARPFGEAKLKLARALALAGRIDEARTLVNAASAMEWRAGDIREVRRELAWATGRTGR
jgi:tetratricopeptide (TPR) repeat protein